MKKAIQGVLITLGIVCAVLFVEAKWAPIGKLAAML